MENKKYSIVFYLEGDVLNQIRSIQEELTNLTGSRKCIDAWMPHMTLGSGIVVAENQIEKTEKKFELIASQIKPFNVELKDFGGTEHWAGAREGLTTPYVLWIDPIMNSSLESIFLKIKGITDNYDTFYPRITTYVPHATVAYGDLTKEGFDKGWEYLKMLNFSNFVKVNHVSLVENFPDKDIEYKRFNFTG